MKEIEQWATFGRSWSPNRRMLLFIFVILVFPTRSYFIQEIRFWLLVLAILVALGMLFLATFILLREAGHRGHDWMKMQIGKLTAAKHRRLILRNTMPGQLPHR